MDQIEFVVEQYRTRYWYVMGKHFHEALLTARRSGLGVQLN